ncbi:MAG: methyltransferase domain-containing protein [Actinomycetes bacterium]
MDEGWGRAATDFATLSEPGNCREYVALHGHLGLRPGDRVLDLACGAGLALELAAAQGATCAGIDASERLVAVARDRTPDADLRVGDMCDLPWEDGTFDVVTSFRGIWGTTPEAVAEARRVLAPGGRLGLTVWGHLKVSSGAWALAPFQLAAEEKVANQASMVALGRPGVGEALLVEHGFEDVRRVDIPFAWEFPDPETYARALASTGPAHEAIQAVGEEAFLEHCVRLASERVRDGLPLRAEIAVVGFLARRPRQPAATTSGAGFLEVPPTTPAVQSLYDDDVEQMGFVMNASRLWATDPEGHELLFGLAAHATRVAGISIRERGILVTACASRLGDAYCSLAWGGKLASVADADLAAGVLAGDDDALDDRERALARWARAVTSDPNGTTAADVEALRAAGFDDRQVFGITTYVAVRIAFSTVNDALGACPDPELAATGPPQVTDAVTWGRPPAPA